MTLHFALIGLVGVWPKLGYLLAGVLILGTAWAYLNRRLQALAEAESPKPELPLADDRRTPPQEERRAQPRWQTDKVSVSISDADSKKVVGAATIFDRSVDGIRLVGDLKLDAGARILIRPIPGGGSDDGAKAEVRYCRRADDTWVLGCRFTQPLTWEASARLG